MTTAAWADVADDVDLIVGAGVKVDVAGAVGDGDLRGVAGGEGAVEGGVGGEGAVVAKARTAGRKVRNFIGRSLKILWNLTEYIQPWLLLPGEVFQVVTWTAEISSMDYCWRMTVSPGLRPERTSVLVPLEMPALMATMRRPFFSLGVGDFDGGVAVLVVEDGLFGDGEDVFVLFEEDFGVGGHVGFELAAGVVDGDADLKGGDVVLFDAEGSDAGDFAEEGLVLEGFDLDAGGLAQVDLADVGLVDLALDVDLVDVADGHDEGGGAADDEDGADGVAFFDVAGEDDAVHWGGDGGVGELLLKLLERGLGLLIWAWAWRSLELSTVIWATALSRVLAAARYFCWASSRACWETTPSLDIWRVRS